MINFIIENLFYDQDHPFSDEGYEELVVSMDKFNFDLHVYKSLGVPAVSADSLDAIATITPVFIAVTKQ